MLRKYEPHFPVECVILMTSQYFPYLLDITKSGEYDPSFVFTYEDDFENIATDYAKFNNHELPGGLKVCLATTFGRSQ
jgi:threonine dehydrogenase-like Zn-dependent dehydrogenase